MFSFTEIISATTNYFHFLPQAQYTQLCKTWDPLLTPFPPVS